MSPDDLIRMYTARGWPLLACRPHGKDPLAELVPHGVKDASSDPEVIRRWLDRWPEANLAVACGAPGPQALDIDDPPAVPEAVAKAIEAAPRTASPRGGAAFFAGTDEGTINLGYGELRGCGSYQLIPPSIHPSGKEYVWIVEPRGELAPVPVPVERGGRRPGTGAHEPPKERVAHGARHDYLKDIAVRLARGGIADERLLLALLRAAFEADCVTDPPPQPGSLEKLAAWAAGSEIAERVRADEAQPVEMRDELARLTRLAEDDLGVQAIRLIGNGPSAALEMRLSSGLTIFCERFGDLWTHTGLAKFITQNTGINAGAITKEDANRANALIRQLADIARATEPADLGREHGHDFLERAPLARFRLNDRASRYGAFAEVRRKEEDGEVTYAERSLVLLDESDGVRYVRTGHLYGHVRRRGEVVHPLELARRMELAGWWRKGRRGLIKATSATTSHPIVLGLWRVPAGWEES